MCLLLLVPSLPVINLKCDAESTVYWKLYSLLSVVLIKEIYNQTGQTNAVRFAWDQ